jgi:hypothetical protein
MIIIIATIKAAQLYLHSDIFSILQAIQLTGAYIKKTYTTKFPLLYCQNMCLEEGGCMAVRNFGHCTVS